LLLALVLTVVVAGCGSSGAGSHQNQAQQNTDQAMDDEVQARITEARAAFAKARRDPALVRGDVLPSASVSCSQNIVRSASGAAYVRIERPMPERVGYLHIEIAGQGSAYVSADFVESVDRQQRIFRLTALTADSPKQQLLRLNQRIIGEVADLVQTYHAKCISTETRTVTSFVLVAPAILDDRA